MQDLRKIKGLSNKNIELFGQYLFNKLLSFYESELDEEQKQIPDTYQKQQENTTSSSIKKKINDNSNNDKQFIDFLKDIRRRISDYNNLKPIYLVFNNEALNEIATIKPKSIEELKQIKGIGEKKCDIFGEYLIKEINKYLKNS